MCRGGMRKIRTISDFICTRSVLYLRVHRTKSVLYRRVHRAYSKSVLPTLVSLKCVMYPTESRLQPDVKPSTPPSLHDVDAGPAGAPARAGGDGPMWGPSMLKDEDGVISLFYSQSSKCRVNPELREDGWNPGGDILMTQSEDGEDWSYPVVLSSQGEGWPLVTANPPVVMRSGSGGTNWAIPVWRESPRAGAEIR